MYGEERNYMKILSTMLVTVILLVIGFLFLSSGVNNAGNNVSKPSVKKTQSGEYHSQFKRRDFIMEKRDNERKETNIKKNVRQINAGRYHDDYMVYNRQDSDRSRYDGFR
jgi:hypothetical protein